MPRSGGYLALVTTTIMHPLEHLVHPNRKAFAADPFGYGASGWHKWENTCLVAGVRKPMQTMPNDDDLKSPILWLCHAEALSQAAIHLVRTEPTFESMPVPVRGICDCQFIAAALMLVGYSLEVCLKGLIILTHGVEAYKKNEKAHRHHELVKLAELIPGLTEKEKAILKTLTHFTTWAGRYPDPGTKYFSNAEEIFSLSETYKITAGELFRLAARIMGAAKELVGGREPW